MVKYRYFKKRFRKKHNNNCPHFSQNYKYLNEIDTSNINSEKSLLLKKNSINIYDEYCPFDSKDFFSNQINYNNKASISSFDKSIFNANNNISFMNSSFTGKILKNSNNKPKVIGFSTKENIYKFLCDICQKKYKRKEYLKKHKFFAHSEYKGMDCIYCGKHIIRITDHIKTCKIKYENNVIKNNNNNL
jgi:hypothetical protein